MFHVAIALLRRNGRWLVARRFDDAHLGGLWEFPGGKVEPDESPAAAAIRELYEECAVEGRAVSRLPEVTVEYQDRVIVLLPIVCEWVSGYATALGSQECRWVELDELEQLNMSEANRPVLDALRGL
jgi:mutator protein MutT